MIAQIKLTCPSTLTLSHIFDVAVLLDPVAHDPQGLFPRGWRLSQLLRGLSCDTLDASPHLPLFDFLAIEVPCRGYRQQNAGCRHFDLRVLSTNKLLKLCSTRSIIGLSLKPSIMICRPIGIMECNKVLRPLYVGCMLSFRRPPWSSGSRLGCKAKQLQVQIHNRQFFCADEHRNSLTESWSLSLSIRY